MFLKKDKVQILQETEIVFDYLIKFIILPAIQNSLPPKGGIFRW